MWRGLRSLSPLVLGCSDGGGDAGTLPDHPWSLRPVDPGEAQQACLGNLLDADNFSKPLLLLVPLPGFCSHTHFPPTCASLLPGQWSFPSLPQIELAISAFVIVPTLQLILLLIAILTLGRREKPLVQKLVAEFLCGCLPANMVPRILPFLHTPAAPPIKKGHLLSLPSSLGWSWNLFRSTECVGSDHVPVPG